MFEISKIIFSKHPLLFENTSRLATAGKFSIAKIIKNSAPTSNSSSLVMPVVQQTMNKEDDAKENGEDSSREMPVVVMQKTSSSVVFIERHHQQEQEFGVVVEASSTVVQDVNKNHNKHLMIIATEQNGNYDKKFFLTCVLELK